MSKTTGVLQNQEVRKTESDKFWGEDGEFLGGGGEGLGERTRGPVQGQSGGFEKTEKP